jgi:hypothetical protein
MTRVPPSPPEERDLIRAHWTRGFATGLHTFGLLAFVLWLGRLQVSDMDTNLSWSTIWGASLITSLVFHLRSRKMQRARAAD